MLFRAAHFLKTRVRPDPLPLSRAGSTVGRFKFNSQTRSHIGQQSIIKGGIVDCLHNSDVPHSQRDIAFNFLKNSRSFSAMFPTHHRPSGLIIGLHHFDVETTIQLSNLNHRLYGGIACLSSASDTAEAEKFSLPQEVVSSSFIPELEAINRRIQLIQEEIKQTGIEITSTKNKLADAEVQLTEENLTSERKDDLLNPITFLSGEIQRLEFQLREELHQLGDEKARFVNEMKKYPLVGLHQKHFIEGAIRADRFDKPLLLVPDKDECKIELMEREPAAKFILSHLENRVDCFHRGSKVVSMTNAPILTVCGGPGSGKSRFLDALAQPEKRVKFLELEKTKLSQKAYDTLKDAIGISVTFKDIMPYSKFECDALPCNALALRIFYSYFINPEKCAWGTFCQSVSATILHQRQVLKFIIADIDKHFDTKSRHVIICVDETLLCVSDRAPQEKLQSYFSMLTAFIGANLELSTRVHFILSSLSLKLVQNACPDSSRGWLWRPMSALSDQSVDTIYSHCWQDPNMDAETQRINRQFMLDAGGSPFLLYASSQLLSTNHQSLESLRAKLKSTAPLIQLQKTIVSPHLRNALLLALKGDIFFESESDPCIVRGLLVLKRRYPQHSSIVGTIAPSVFYCIHSDPQMDPIASKLITLTREFFSCDREYHGVLFENQFSLLLQIRCLIKCSPMQTQQSSPKHNENVEKLLSSLMELSSLNSLLDVSDYDRCFDSEPKDPRFLLYGDLFNASYHIPAALEVVTSEVFSFKPGTLWTPSNPNYAGVDALLSLKNKSGEEVVFGFQYKWSRLISNDKSTDHDNCLDCNTVAKAISNTCKHHGKELSEYMLSNRFGFVATAFRDISIPVDHNYHTMWQEKVRKHWKKATTEDNNLIVAATKNVLIFGKEHMKKLLNPTLNRRLAYAPTSSSSSTSSDPKLRK